MFRACFYFILLMVCGLVIQTVTHEDGGRPEDDPVHGSYVRPPITQAIVDHRDEWRAALDYAEKNDPPRTYNTEHVRRLEWIRAAGWPVTDPLLEADIWAWHEVYCEWEWEQSKAGWVKDAEKYGGPLPTEYRRESYK